MAILMELNIRLTLASSRDHFRPEKEWRQWQLAILYSDMNSFKSGLLHLSSQPYCKKGKSAKVKDGIINYSLKNYFIDWSTWQKQAILKFKTQPKTLSGSIYHVSFCASAFNALIIIEIAYLYADNACLLYLSDMISICYICEPHSWG